MHYLQRRILKYLAQQSTGTWSDIQPAEIGNSLFGYHLRELLKAGYVGKHDDIYRLSPKGERYVDRLSHQDFSVPEQPKLIVILVATTASGEQVLYQRQHEPYMEKWGFPSGKIAVGETPQEAAGRVATNKIGPVEQLAYSYTTSIEIQRNGDTISHVYGVVFTCRAVGAVRSCTDKGYTCTESEVPASASFMPGFRNMQEQAGGKGELRVIVAQDD